MPRGYQRAPVYDDTKGTVHIWARDGRAPARLTNLIPGDVRREVNSHSDKLGNPGAGLPRLADKIAAAVQRGDDVTIWVG